MFLQIIVVAFVFLLLYNPVLSTNSVLINEFVIDSPQTVEIYNSGSESIDLSGWYIDDNGGSTYYTIPAGSLINPSSCLVFSGDFNLNKSSADSVRLFDKTAPPTDSGNHLIDAYSYKSATESAMSFMRKPDGGDNWITGAPTLGKLNETNVSCLSAPTPTVIPTSTNAVSEPMPTSVENSVSYDHVYISEVMPYPDKDQNEWIELYNDNDFNVTLDKWYIDDIFNGGSSPKQFTLSIEAKKYGIIDLSSSMFNNDEDSVTLLDPQKNVKDNLEYGFTQQGKSLGRTSWDSDTLCLQESSRGIVNNSCLQLTSAPSPSVKPQPSVQATQNQISPTNKPLFTSSIADFNQSIGSTNPAPTGEVLSVSDQAENPRVTKAAVRAFSFASFSYAFLASVTLLIKLKSYFV